MDLPVLPEFRSCSPQSGENTSGEFEVDFNHEEKVTDSVHTHAYNHT